jgi:hypothetical protein
MENQIAALFLEFSCNKLDLMLKDVRACVGRLTDAQVWERHGAHENAVGNLVLHLCGNIRQWVMHGVGGAKDIRVRDAEFSTNGGLTATALIELFEKTVAEARGIIASLPAERLIERITPQNRDVAVLDAIYQVVGHVQQHCGQIILVTKQMIRQDLDLTMPRPR